jgi:hypothetical protein
MGNFKKLYGWQANCSGIDSGIFFALIPEFSGGKLKQKGFFHSARRTGQDVDEVWFF